MKLVIIKDNLLILYPNYICALQKLIFQNRHAGRLTESQYPEGPVTGHLVSGFSWFPWVLEQML